MKSIAFMQLQVGASNVGREGEGREVIFLHPNTPPTPPVF
jgi:hypothetical protein